MTALAISVLSGCAGYVPGRQSYWDEKVKEMCEKDGGVKIIEKLHISKSDIELLGTVGGKVGIPPKSLADPKAPAYQEFKIVDLKEGNPRVSRTEMTVVRRADQAVVAQAVIYARSGGDIPGPAHTSSYSCPDLKTINTELQQLFVVDEEPNGARVIFN